jgi:hypothetical protein
MQIRKSSSGFCESDNLPKISKTFSAEKEIVFTDETRLTFASSALATILAKFTRVGSPE